MQNNHTLQWVNSLVAMLLIVVAGASNAADQPPLTHKLTPIKNPAPAPKLRLQDMDEEVIDLKDLKGKTVVVNFWATWCPPCRREMGSLERMYQATKDKDVEVLAVDVGEDLDTVFAFLGTIEPEPEFKVLFDTEGGLMNSWKVRGLPTTFIINPEGKIVYRAVGGREFDHPEIIKAVTSFNSAGQSSSAKNLN